MPRQERRDPCAICETSDAAMFGSFVRGSAKPICRGCLQSEVGQGEKFHALWVYAWVRRDMRWGRLTLWEAMGVPPALVTVYPERCFYGAPDLHAIVKRNGNDSEDYMYLVEALWSVADELERRAEERAGDAQ